MENEETTEISRMKFVIPWKEFLSFNLVFLAIWIGFLLYTFIWAPESQPGDPTFSSLMNIKENNPLAWAIFNLIAVWSLLYAAILLIENRERFLPSWPFILASFAAGMYALMPYFSVRGAWKKKTKEKRSIIMKIADSKITAGIVAILVFGLVLYGIIASSINNSWTEYGNLFLNDRLIHVMTIDFTFLTLFYPVLIWDDMKRRNWENKKFFWLFSLLPIIGPSIYLIVRPRIK
ncbi:hypothetical protein ES708_27412 [subsurface metagenome]